MRPVSDLVLVSSIALTLLATEARAGEEPAERTAGSVVSDRLLVKLAREVELPAAGLAGAIGEAEFDALARQVGVTNVRPLFRKPPRGRRDPAAAAALGLDRWVRVELGAARGDVDVLARRFGALRSVDVAEVDRFVTVTLVPNDPDYAGSQWPLKPAFIDAQGAWDLKTDSSDQTVFVIDTGIQTSHPDIAANLWVNSGEIAANGIDDEGNGFVDDVHGWNFTTDDNDIEDGYGHGIHVSGIIGAATDNSVQVAGVNWVCRIGTGRMFDDWGIGTWEMGAAATVYATDNGATVINDSWGEGAPGPQAFEDAMRYADDAGVLQVAAAGNWGTTAQFWPAAYDEMLSVAATDSTDARAWFSTHGDWIDMAAPGDGIWNLYLSGTATWLSGTSMAAPHVAGAAALVRSVNPQLTHEETRVTLRLMSDDLGTAGFDDDYGFGRLDVNKAVTAANSIVLSTRSPTRPGQVDILMRAKSEAGMLHVLLAGMSGIQPGLDLLAVDPNDPRIFPLNYDFLVQFQLSNPINGITGGFIDYLDGNGVHQGNFNVVGGKLFKDKTISLCFCTFDPNDLSTVRFISAPTSFEVP